MAITRLNHFEAKRGREADLRAFLESVIGLIRGSAGALSVELLVSVEHPERFAIVEVWESVEAHQAAAKLVPPEKIQQVMPMLASPVTGEYFRPAGA